MAPRPQSAGFTLVEMLVAIALLGLLGVISWRGLDFVVAQRERVDQESEQLGRMLRVLAQIERDIALRAPDSALPVPPAPGALPPSIAVQIAEDGAMALEIVRSAPDAAGANGMQRIAYRANAGALVRWTSPPAARWPVPPVTQKTVLLPGGRNLKVRIFSGGFWAELRPGGGVQPTVRSTGIEVSVEDGEGGRYVRMLAL